MLGDQSLLSAGVFDVCSKNAFEMSQSMYLRKKGQASGSYKKKGKHKGRKNVSPPSAVENVKMRNSSWAGDISF